MFIDKIVRDLPLSQTSTTVFADDGVDGSSVVESSFGNVLSWGHEEWPILNGWIHLFRTQAMPQTKLASVTNFSKIASLLERVAAAFELLKNDDSIVHDASLSIALLCNLIYEDV